MARRSTGSIRRSATWFRRRFPEGPTPPQRDGVAAHRGRHRHADRRADRFGQDARRLPRVHRPPVPRARRGRADRGDRPRRLRVAVEGAGRRHRGEPRSGRWREIAEIARELGLDPPDIKVGVRTGDTTSSRAHVDGAQAAELRGDHAGVAVPARHERERARGAAHGRHRSSSTRSTQSLATSGARTSRSPSSGSKHCATPGPPASGCRRRNGRSRPSRACWWVSGTLPQIVDSGHVRELDLAVELPGGRARGRHQCGADVRRARSHRRARAGAPHHARVRRTRGDSPSGSRTNSASAWVTMSWPRTTARCRRTAASASSHACVRASSSAWSRPPRSSSASTSGPVELVCQIGSPRSIATFLQRVGRSNHTRRGVPEGHPLSAHARRARRMRGVARGGARRSPRRHPSAGHMPLDIARPADDRRGRGPGLGHRRRSSSSCARPIPTATCHVSSSTTLIDLVGERRRDRSRAARSLPVPRRGQQEVRARKGARIAALTSRRRDPRDRRLPRRRRARRHVHRHRERRLGRRVDGGRHLPARHPLVADPPHRGGRRARARRG